MLEIACRRCLVVRQVRSTGLDAGICPSCAELGVIEVGWVEADRVEFVERLPELCPTADQMIDDLLLAALEHFEDRLAPDARHVRAAVALLHDELVGSRL